LGAPNFALLQQYGVQVLTATDAQVVAAMRLLWQRAKLLVEPSSAVALAIVLAHPDAFAGQRVGIILSGGNVDLDALPALFALGAEEAP
jgi:threonine dehydratase